MMNLYDLVAGRRPVEAPVWTKLTAYCSMVEDQDRRFLADMKSLIRQGVIVFEELETRTIVDGGDRLVALLDRVPGIVQQYSEAVAAAIVAIGPVPGAPFTGSGVLQH